MASSQKKRDGSLVSGHRVKQSRLFSAKCSRNRFNYVNMGAYQSMNTNESSVGTNLLRVSNYPAMKNSSYSNLHMKNIKKLRI